MANNPNVNKVIYDGTTLIDVTDTTATASDVLSGKTFTLASGAKATGSLVTTEYTAGDGIDLTNDIISNTKPMNYEITGSVPSATPLNADQLQGHPASYFATASDVGDIANLTTTDKTSIVNAINELNDFDLLWTNSSPTSDFGPRTVHINTTGYRLFYVKYRPLNTSTLRAGAFYHLDGARTFCIGLWSGFMVYRIATASNSGIYFENGNRVPTYAGAAVVDNAYMVPVEIYGLR